VEKLHGGQAGGYIHKYQLCGLVLVAEQVKNMRFFFRSAGDESWQKRPERELDGNATSTEARKGTWLKVTW